MYKKTKFKITRDFINKNFPENLLPIKKWNKKEKKNINTKKRFLRLRKRIREAEQELLKQYNNTLFFEKKHQSLKKNKHIIQSNQPSGQSITIPKSNNVNSLGPTHKICSPNKVGPFFEVKQSSSRKSLQKSNLLDIGDISDRQRPTRSSIIAHKKGKGSCFYYLFTQDQIKHQLSKKGRPSKRASTYCMQLRERKKLSILYGGLSTKFLSKYIDKSSKSRGKITENLFIFLEKRLDVVLYRICFFNSIRAARQSISHNHVQVNSKIVNISSFLLKPGDIISIVPDRFSTIQNQILLQIKSRLFKRRRRFFTRPKKIDTKNQNKVGHTLSKLQSSVKYKKKTDVISGISFFNKKSCLLQSKIGFLKSKKKLYRNRSRGLLYAAMRITPMKPMSIEVSFKLLKGIVLFSPQKLAFPALLDMDLIERSLK